MKPIEFKYQTHVLKAPLDMPEVLPLPVWGDGKQTISCWKMNWRERLSALFYGKVWFLSIGKTHPPIYLAVKKEYLKGSEV